MKTFSTQRVPLFPYLKAKEAGFVELPVAELVSVLNIEGVCGTRASCAGHLWPFESRPPFVMFACTMQWSQEISLLVFSLVMSKKLNYVWGVTGRHLPDDGLCWTLLMEDSRSYFSRKKLNQDFAVLTQHFKLLATEFQERVIACNEGIDKKSNDNKNQQILKSPFVGDFSKGIGISAFRTEQG